MFLLSTVSSLSYSCSNLLKQSEEWSISEVIIACRPRTKRYMTAIQREMINWFCSMKMLDPMSQSCLQHLGSFKMESLILPVVFSRYCSLRLSLVSMNYARLGLWAVSKKSQVIFVRESARMLSNFSTWNSYIFAIRSAAKLAAMVGYPKLMI